MFTSMKVFHRSRTKSCGALSYFAMTYLNHSKPPLCSYSYKRIFYSNISNNIAILFFILLYVSSIFILIFKIYLNIYELGSR